MRKKIFAGILSLLLSVSILPVSVNAAENKEAMYTDGFEKAADYAKYTAGTDESLNGRAIWIEGVATKYDTNTNSIIVKTNEGNWAVFCGDGGTDNYKSLVQESVGKNIRVFGKYCGINTTLQLPRIDFIQSDIYERAYRLETADNDFRISYPDYVIDVPALDSENTYGNLTYKDSSQMIKNADDDTLFYYFTEKIPVFMLIHEQELTNSIYDGKSDEEILNNFESYYNMNSKYVVRKERTKIGDTEGIICESSFKDDDMPSSMCLYCYMTIIDRHYYYFGFTQPYLASETVKRLIPQMLADVRYDNGSAPTPAEDIDATEESAPAEASEDVEAPADVETPAEPEDTTEAEAPAAADTEKKFPTLEEAKGRYTMTVEMVQDKGGNKKQTGENIYWGENELANYNEETGVCTLTQDDFIAVITFGYDQNGNVVCHGTIQSGNNVGSVIGIRTSD